MRPLVVVMTWFCLLSLLLACLVGPTSAASSVSSSLLRGTKEDDETTTAFTNSPLQVQEPLQSTTTVVSSSLSSHRQLQSRYTFGFSLRWKIHISDDETNLEDRAPTMMELEAVETATSDWMIEIAREAYAHETLFTPLSATASVTSSQWNPNAADDYSHIVYLHCDLIVQAHAATDIPPLTQLLSTWSTHARVRPFLLALRSLGPPGSVFGEASRGTYAISSTSSESANAADDTDTTDSNIAENPNNNNEEGEANTGDGETTTESSGATTTSTANSESTTTTSTSPSSTTKTYVIPLEMAWDLALLTTATDRKPTITDLNAVVTSTQAWLTKSIQEHYGNTYFTLRGVSVQLLDFDWDPTQNHPHKIHLGLTILVDATSLSNVPSKSRFSVVMARQFSIWDFMGQLFAHKFSDQWFVYPSTRSAVLYHSILPTSP